ncbi:MAG: hypothetical protein ACXQTS_06080 [Candidatus Methanospirareceae archaeon]
MKTKEDILKFLLQAIFKFGVRFKVPVVIEEQLPKMQFLKRKGLEWIEKGNRVTSIDCAGIIREKAALLCSPELENVLWKVYPDETDRYKGFLIVFPYKDLEGDLYFEALTALKKEEEKFLYLHNGHLHPSTLGEIVTNDSFFIVCEPLSEKLFFGTLIHRVSLDKSFKISSLPEEIMVKYAEYKLKT